MAITEGDAAATAPRRADAPNAANNTFRANVAALSVLRSIPRSACTRRNAIATPAVNNSSADAGNEKCVTVARTMNASMVTIATGGIIPSIVSLRVGDDDEST